MDFFIILLFRINVIASCNYPHLFPQAFTLLDFFQFRVSSGEIVNGLGAVSDILHHHQTDTFVPEMKQASRAGGLYYSQKDLSSTRLSSR